MATQDGKRGLRLKSSTEGILEELRALCLSFPETQERNSFGHPNFVAGKKAFVTLEQFQGRPSIAFRLDTERTAHLSKDPQFFPTPYGRGQWVSMYIDGEFDWSTVKELVQASYRLVALKRMIAALDGKS